MGNSEFQIIRLLEKLIAKQEETLKLLNKNYNPKSITEVERQKYRDYVQQRLSGS